MAGAEHLLGNLEFGSHVVCPTGRAHRPPAIRYTRGETAIADARSDTRRVRSPASSTCSAILIRASEFDSSPGPRTRNVRRDIAVAIIERAIRWPAPSTCSAILNSADMWSGRSDARIDPQQFDTHVGRRRSP